VPNSSNTTTRTISQCQMLKPPIETLQNPKLHGAQIARRLI
jgi:hypothetical protein